MEDSEEKIHHYGRESYFVNDNATLDDTRKECVAELTRRMAEPPGTLRVMMHSLAFGAFKPLVGAEEVDQSPPTGTDRRRDGPLAGLLGAGLPVGRPAGSRRAHFRHDQHRRHRARCRNTGRWARPRRSLEAHIRQLAMELAPAGITANAILAGVTDTARCGRFRDTKKFWKSARQRNPSRRLTLPEDVARSIAALCHPATYWLTGNMLHVDGGENIVG